MPLIAYVDESGDEGTVGNGSRWLCLGAVVVDVVDVPGLDALVQRVANVAGRGTPKLPHMREFTHAEKKGVAKLLSDPSNWTGIAVASDTTNIRAGSWLRTPTYQYNYAVRHLIERLSWYADSRHDTVTVVFDRRRNFDLASFQAYLGKLSARNDSHFKWKALDVYGMSQSTPATAPLLCIADALAHSVFKAIEPDSYWKHHERSYLETMAGHLWRGPSGAEGLFGNGFTPMPIDSLTAFQREYPWSATL